MGGGRLRLPPLLQEPCACGKHIALDESQSAFTPALPRAPNGGKSSGGINPGWGLVLNGGLSSSFWRIFSMRRVGLLCIVALLALVSTASADVGIRLDRWSGRPGQIITGTSVARMPLFLIDARYAPQLYRCRANAVCDPYSYGLPRGGRWIRLRRVGSTSDARMRFRVPRIRAGAYRVFVYCEPCYIGRRGSLVTDHHRIFRVLP